ncbi:MAG: glutamine synthetase type III [Planctomycetes bacterium]|nr:glutamine synthetase type III [Planctomycetota bacterium]
MSRLANRPLSFIETLSQHMEPTSMPDAHADSWIRDAASQFGDRYGILTFAGENVRRRLSPSALERLERTTTRREPLDPRIADEIATAMKDWAIENGCTHYCHWFQPLTGSTAEKHDSFLSIDSNGQPITEFSGNQLIQAEPDASSFPSGGIRDTWEARGYTAWDPTSPAFIVRNGGERTLCIPTCFVSWTGESLDQKTPLLRSDEAISKQAMRVLRLFGNSDGVDHVTTTLGIEQEYFLIDEDLAAMRADIILCGRTIMGADSPKGHQLDDHYFGAIPRDVQAYMADVEARLFELGIPAKTRHNEVAPRQFELAPLFERSNLASDHQMLTMSVLQKVARLHGLRCLIHEKPFKGINGTGKHNNWAISTDTGHNLLSPGKAGQSNLQFLTFVCAVVRALDLHADILRASVANAGNDHRLGANEAPPAILSIYTGEELGRVLENLATGETSDFRADSSMDLGTAAVPKLQRHSGDRNRTSPFAFIGNRFEFRAVGGTASVAWPNAVLNTIITESIDWIVTEMEKHIDGNGSVEAAAIDILGGVMRDHHRVIFNGDNYNTEWHEEAARRGLPILRGTADALPALRNDSVREMFNTYGVMSPTEVDARVDVLFETYVHTMGIEARTMLQMAETMVLPAATRYQTDLATAISTTEAAGVNCPASGGRLHDLVEHVTELEAALTEIRTTLEYTGESCDAHARAVQDRLVPAMDNARAHCDAIESTVPADLWPMPTYTDLLFGGE